MPASFVFTTQDGDGNLVISVQTSDPNEVGEHKMVLVVTMAGNIAQLEQRFTVSILNCMLTAVEIDVPQPIELTYTFDGPLTEALPEPVPTPSSCTVGYDFAGPFMPGTDTVPPFARIVKVDGQDYLVIDTLDTALHGMAQPLGYMLVDVQYTPEGEHTSEINGIIQYRLTFDACALNTFIVDPQIDDFNYDIDQGPVTVEGSFMSRFADCPSP